jgi:predicted lipid-binding transport protein (Tim44 family)
MAAPTAPATKDLRTVRATGGAALNVVLGVVLAMSTGTACAAALGSLATSVGLLAALVSVFVVKGWPAQLPSSVLSTAGGALLVAGGVGWLLWRMRAVGRVAALAGAPSEGPERGAVSVARALPATEIVLPVGVERDALLADLRCHFVQLQRAWDHADMTLLRALTTPEMLDELCLELSGSTGGGTNRTEVVTLRAELLGFESLAQVCVVSVEFSGLLRESADSGAVPFRELWLLTRSKHEAAAWCLARHQALI